MPATVGYSQRSRLDKLGVKPGMRVALIGVAEPGFVAELGQRTAGIREARPARGTDMIFLGVETGRELTRLAALRGSIRPAGAIWAIWPKGQKHIGEDMIRRAAIAQGLVDIKVIAFSERLSGLKLVIPVARRAAAAAGGSARAAAPAGRPKTKAGRPKAPRASTTRSRKP